MFFFVAIYSISCTSSEKINLPRLELNNITLTKYIQEFNKTLHKKPQPEKILTINVNLSGDTTTIDLINSLPDTNIAKIKALASYNDLIVYLVGIYPQDSFFRINRSNGIYDTYTIPKYENPSIQNLRSVETLFWKLYFVNDSLVRTFLSNADSRIWTPN
jgi:hypothetical protein